MTRRKKLHRQGVFYWVEREVRLDDVELLVLLLKRIHG